jgi:hypothetical protein
MYELDSREAKVCQVEPLLPLARQLQDLGTDINQFLPWVETIHEKAETEKMDLRAAAYSVAQDLRSYRQVNSLQKSIQQMQQRLTMLNMQAHTQWNYGIGQGNGNNNMNMKGQQPNDDRRMSLT